MKNVNRATTQVMMKTGHVEKTNDRDYEVEERWGNAQAGRWEVRRRRLTGHQTISDYGCCIDPTPIGSEGISRLAMRYVRPTAGFVRSHQGTATHHKLSIDGFTNADRRDDRRVLRRCRLQRWS